MKVISLPLMSAGYWKCQDYLPHNYTNNCVVYTEPTMRHLAGMGISLEERHVVREYLGTSR